jgi:hypothetical protein
MSRASADTVRVQSTLSKEASGSATAVLYDGTRGEDAAAATPALDGEEEQTICISQTN